MRQADSREAPLLLRVEEAAKLLGVGRTTVFAMVSARELRVVRIGRSVRIPREALEHWIREHLEADAPDEDAVGSAGYAIPRVHSAFRPGAPQPGP